VAGAEPGAPADGRAQRSARTRARLVEAVRAAVASGEDPTPSRVAARAGVSERTLFRLFGDLPALWAAVRAQMAADVTRHLDGRPFEGDLPARARELVRRRIRAFEAMAPYRRWVDPREVLYPAIRQGREMLDRALRAQAAEALGPELAVGAASIAPIVDGVLSYESWDYLRASRGLPPRRVASLLETAVLRLVAPPAAGGVRRGTSRRSPGRPGRSRSR
jgi:AcrR family transcriptional regulator